MSVLTRRFLLFACITAVLPSLALTSCRPSGSGAEQNVTLQGAGASFPNPLYQKWVSEYSKLHANVRLDYQPIGSGGGIKQIQAQTVDFGATDTPMKPQDIKAAAGEIVHIPTVLGAVVITHNLPNITQSLKFSGEVIADIFMGKIKKWNDPKIAAENPGVTFPSTDITVVHRSDGSGTSAVFTDYLAKVSPEWKEKVGVGISPSWPVGLGGKGNDGVAGQIKNTPNTIGYVELAYAVQNKLPVAHLKNAAGSFIEPSIDSVSAAAAASAATTVADPLASITNAQGATSYPISSYTYILVYKNQKDAAKGKAVVDFLWWAIHDGEKHAAGLHYAPLPDAVVKHTEERLNSITANGAPLRSAS